jgi:2-C-methyl-D-erythritol 4-phosphate cytidylyltransferase
MTGPEGGALPRVGVAVPAAGVGQRMGGVRKPFLRLAGEPILLHAIRPFLTDERVVAVVVALAADTVSDPPPWLLDVDARVSVVAGGQTRTDSVRAALAALPAATTVIAVHDAARPLVSTEVVSTCIDVAATGVGAVAGHPASDTMKTVDAHHRVVSTPDRTTLWHAQTPQVFPADLLRKAYATATDKTTDDSALVERLGAEVRMIDAGAANLKVTWPGDLALAEAYLRSLGPT